MLITSALIWYNSAMGKAEENKKQKREALLNTAFDLFTVQGFPSTSISNIAEKAGVAKGTFYLYFRDKYDLRDRLIRHKAAEILEQAFRAMEKTACRTLEDKILFLCAYLIGLFSQDKALLKFISKNLSWAVLKHDVGTIPPIDYEEEANFAAEIERTFAESEVQYKNPEVMLYMIVEFVGSACYSSILEGEPLSVEELRPYILESVRAIMRAQEVPQEVPQEIPQ